ncbi:MAG: hypothetical protein ACKOEL_07795 [Planctomycetota bacterium]
MTRVPAFMALLALLAACSSDPETVLQSDLPQVPGMAPRDTVDLRQEAGRVVAGQFAYTGAIPALAVRVSETMARFEGMGWKLESQTLTGSTAVLVYGKDDRTATVQIIRNGLQPLMSTAVTTVERKGAAPEAPAAPAADAPAPAAPVIG